MAAITAKNDTKKGIEVMQKILEQHLERLKEISGTDLPKIDRAAVLLSIEAQDQGLEIILDRQVDQLLQRIYQIKAEIGMLEATLETLIKVAQSNQ